MRILVIYGGFGLSSEAEISKASGLAVLNACKLAKYETEGFELNEFNIDSVANRVSGFDLVIPMLHGQFGEDGRIQKILEDIGVPFVGSGSVSSQLCFNKVSTKKILDDNNIQTPKWEVIKEASDLEGWNYPLVLKPIEGGSSIGVAIVKSSDDLRNIDFSRPILAEEYIAGQELTVGILGDTALPVVEIIPPENRWFDYEVKYNNATQENIPPKYISTEIQEQAQAIALHIHKLCGCRHLSRVDMILRRNRLFILEINTLPGMTPESIYPKAAKAVGLDMRQLMGKLVLLATD
ncbi:MAG: D-alanine--D-alanine ligase [Patescibacteria group bacterium]